MLNDMKKKFLTETLLDERTSEICAKAYVDNLRADSLFPNEAPMKRQMHNDLRSEFPERGVTKTISLKFVWNIILVLSFLLTICKVLGVFGRKIGTQPSLF